MHSDLPSTKFQQTSWFLSSAPPREIKYRLSKLNVKVWTYWVWYLTLNNLSFELKSQTISAAKAPVYTYSPVAILSPLLLQLMLQMYPSWPFRYVFYSFPIDFITISLPLAQIKCMSEGCTIIQSFLLRLKPILAVMLREELSSFSIKYLLKCNLSGQVNL